MSTLENPAHFSPERRGSIWNLRPWMLISAAWIGPAALAILNNYVQAKLGERGSAQWRVLLWVGADWLLYGALTPLVFLLARRFPLERRVLFQRLTIHLVAAIFGCALWAGGGIILRWLIFPAPQGTPSREFAASWFFTTLPFGVAIYFFVLGIEHALFFHTEARDQAERTTLLSRQLAEARLGALRMQLHPHFLFNSLNAVTVLLRDGNVPAAGRVLEELGELLREVLRRDQPEEVPLSREIEFLKRYLGIEQVRFPERLRSVFDVDSAVLDASVPRFLLQPIVENALRHAIAKRADAGLVRIIARREGADLVLSVQDDGPGLDPDAALQGAGVGLSNTRERLAAHFGPQASLELAGLPERGVRATIRIPFRLQSKPGEARSGG